MQSPSLSQSPSHSPHPPLPHPFEEVLTRGLTLEEEEEEAAVVEVECGFW